MAAYNGQEAVVKLLLDTGKVNVDAQDKDGVTAIFPDISEFSYFYAPTTALKVYTATAENKWGVCRLLDSRNNQQLMLG